MPVKSLNIPMDPIDFDVLASAKRKYEAKVGHRASWAVFLLAMVRHKNVEAKE